MLLAYFITYALTDGKIRDIAQVYFFVLMGLLVLNLFAALVAAMMGKAQTALGLCFAILGILLIGLGTCAYSIQQVQGN